MLAPFPRPRRSFEHRVQNPVEPTAERLWDDVSGRLRDTLNETDVRHVVRVCDT